MERNGCDSIGGIIPALCRQVHPHTTTGIFIFGFSFPRNGQPIEYARILLPSRSNGCHSSTDRGAPGQNDRVTFFFFENGFLYKLWKQFVRGIRFLYAVRYEIGVEIIGCHPTRGSITVEKIKSLGYICVFTNQYECKKEER